MQHAFLIVWTIMSAVTFVVYACDKIRAKRGKWRVAMRKEFERLLPVMRQGGFVPSVDHQTPPGVSLENYRIYLKLLKEYTEKAVL